MHAVAAGGWLLTTTSLRRWHSFY